ncbi:MAG: NAD-dependent epimerase/dehydratase family protein [Nocardioidaceae bacterium]
MGRVVLVTGVARDLGAGFARALATTPGIDKVVGLDVFPPQADLQGVKFVRVDIRTPVVGKVLAVEDIDTVVHMNVAAPQRGIGARGSIKELNVIGTMQLLAACQGSANVSKLVLQSATAVYGTSPRDPAMFTESMAARGGIGGGFPKDAVEVEGYARGFGRRRPDVLLTTLRMSNVLGHGVLTPFGEFFKLPALPTVLGYDPRLQFVHPEDAWGALTRAVVEDHPGIFNVAGADVVSLGQAARRLGRPTLRLPSLGFATMTHRLVRAMKSDFTPELSRLLMYGRVVDTTALRETFGYEPLHTTPETLDEFAIGARPGVLSAVGGVHG